MRYTYKRFGTDDMVLQENVPTYFLWYLSNAGVGTDGSGDKWVNSSISSWITHAIATTESTAALSGSDGSVSQGDITSKEIYNVIGTKYFGLLNPTTDLIQWSGSSISKFYTIMINSELFLDRLRQQGATFNLTWRATGYASTAYQFRLVNESSTSTVADPSQAGIYYATNHGSLSSTKVGTAFLDDGILCFMRTGAETVTGLLSAIFATGTSPLTGCPLSAADNLPAFINNTSASSVCQGITANSIEYQNSYIYFCEAKNKEFNYSLNTTWSVTASSYVGTRRVRDEFLTVPKTYITGIGLYNDNGELLAVAKTNIPRKKDKYSRSLFKVKITI